MKPYNKKQKKGKFEKEKLNSKTGFVTKTKSSVLEAKNANRSLKKSVRQLSKEEIKRAQEIDLNDKAMLELGEIIEKEVGVKWLTSYKDGGTAAFIDKNGKKYFEDHRIKVKGTSKEGLVYSKYPDNKGAELLDVILIKTSL